MLVCPNAPKAGAVLVAGVVALNGLPKSPPLEVAPKAVLAGCPKPERKQYNLLNNYKTILLNSYLKLLECYWYFRTIPLSFVLVPPVQKVHRYLWAELDFQTFQWTVEVEH